MKRIAFAVAAAAAMLVPSVGSANYGCQQSCNSCPGRYVPGQCFTTSCGSGSGCNRPVCQTACNPCAPAYGHQAHYGHAGHAGYGPGYAAGPAYRGPGFGPAAYGPGYGRAYNGGGIDANIGGLNAGASIDGGGAGANIGGVGASISY